MKNHGSRLNPYRVAAWTAVTIFIALLVGFTAAQFIINKDVKTAVKKAGRDYGTSHSDRDCVLASLFSVQDKEHKAPIPKVDQFLSGCLETARGPRLFCEGVPTKNHFLENVYWRVKIAEAFACSAPGCDQIFAVIQDFCQSRYGDSGAIFVSMPPRSQRRS